MGITRQGRVLLTTAGEIGLMKLCHFRPQGINIRSEEKMESWGGIGVEIKSGEMKDEDSS